MNNKAFTLIELLVSVTITAVIVGIVYATFFNVMDVSEKLNNSGDLNYQAVMFFGLMEKDLDSLYAEQFAKNTKNKKKNDSKKSNQPYFVIRSIDLENLDEENPFLEFFSTFSLNPNGHPQFIINKISYFIKKQNTKDKNIQRFSIIRKELPFSDIKSKFNALGVEVACSVVKIKIKVIDKDSNEQDEYDSRKNKNRYPIALDFSLEFSGKSKKQSFEKLFIIGVNK